MRFLSVRMLFVAVVAMLWLSFLADASSESGTKGDTEVSGRRFLSLGPFRPFMRVLGMMGIPLLPLLLLRQLMISGAAATTQAQGGGAGLGSMGALGILGPFGAGAGLGGLRPTGGAAAAAGGLRPLGLRPLAGRPLSNLIAGAAGAGAAGAGAGAGGADALFLRKRSTEHEKGGGRFSGLVSALAKLEQVVDHYDLSVPDCQRRFVCELHRQSLNPSFGSLTEKLIQAFGVEARLEKSHFSSNTKSVLKDFLKAARNGLQQRECAAIYYKCPVAVAEKEEKHGKKETLPASENLQH